MILVAIRILYLKIFVLTPRKDGWEHFLLTQIDGNSFEDRSIDPILNLRIVFAHAKVN